VARQQAEADDVNAAVECLLGRSGTAIDPKRIAVTGYSFGGIVTTLAASRGTKYAAVVLQAPGALNWSRSDVRLPKPRAARYLASHGLQPRRW
jgi:dipeptidyl aminopeptidase/acylaminoacyl peptidase